MGQEVASASVSILPTFKGGAKELERVMGPALDRAGASGGQAYGQSFMSSFLSSGLISKFIGAGGIGSILFAGINRYKAIDNATAKLRGLGNEAGQVDKIMQNALASVKGTAFGLGDAVTVAAQLTAAQIPAGQQLEAVLKSVANAAAAAGVGLGEMGSIYAAVATTGKAQNDSLGQVAQRGIPIYQELAKQLGVTADEVFKMASAGEIGFAQFEKAMTAAVGTVADEMGKTLSGRIDNLVAAAGRLGAAFAGPGLDQGKNVLSELTGVLDSLTPIAATLGQGLGFVLGVVNAIPEPVKLAALAFVALKLAAGTQIFARMQTSISGAVTSFRALRTEAMLAGSAMPGIRVGLAGVGSAARAAGSAMLSAFGGPVGLAIAGVSIAIGALIAIRERDAQAAAEQAAAIDALTDTLDVNTGAITANTVSQLGESLDDTIVKMQRLGIDTQGFAEAVAQGGPELDKFVTQLRDIGNEARAGLFDDGNPLLNVARLKYATDAIKAIDAQVKITTASQEKWKRQVDATGEATQSLEPKFKSVKDAVEAAFAPLNSLAAEQAALRGLAESIRDNGKAIDAISKKGSANLEALQTVIAAMAENAGDNYALFVSNVSGLMSYLQAQGIDTSGVLGAVKQSVNNIAGTKFGITFDTSQLIGASNRAIAAIRAVLYAIMVANPTGKNIGAFLGFNAAVVAAAAGAARLTGSMNGAAGSIGKAGSSAKKATTDLKALRMEIYQLAKDWLKPSPYSSEANSLIDQINAAYKEGAISKKQRDSLIRDIKAKDLAMQKIAKDREKLAKQIDEATQKLQDAIAIRDDYRDRIINGFRDLMDVTKFAAADTDATVRQLQDGYKALGALSKYSGEVEKTISTTYRQGDKLITTSQVVKQSKNAASMISSLRDQVKAATDFNANLKKLKSLGLNQTSLDNLLSDFLSSGDGSAVAELLKGGKSAVTEVNSLVNQLGALGGQTQTVAEKQAATRKAITDGLKNQLDQAKKFKSAYNTLSKLGLNDTSLQQLMEQFLSTGDASQIQALVAGGKGTVDELNNIMAEMAKVTGGEKSGWAVTAASEMYQAGVDSAKGFLEGLKAQDSELKKQYEKMAKDLLDTVKKTLGIKSPSRKMGYLAEMTSKGWNNNLHLDPVTPGVDMSDVSSTYTGAGSGLVVIVENPWTGEQVRAHTVQVTRGEMAAQSQARLTSLRGGRRN